MGGRLFGGPTIAGARLGWESRLERWLDPFLECLGHKARPRICPQHSPRSEIDYASRSFEVSSGAMLGHVARVESDSRRPIGKMAPRDIAFTTPVATIGKRYEGCHYNPGGHYERWLTLFLRRMLAALTASLQPAPA